MTGTPKPSGAGVPPPPPPAAAKAAPPAAPVVAEPRVPPPPLPAGAPDALELPAAPAGEGLDSRARMRERLRSASSELLFELDAPSRPVSRDLEMLFPQRGSATAEPARAADTGSSQQNEDAAEALDIEVSAAALTPAENLDAAAGESALAETPATPAPSAPP